MGVSALYIFDLDRDSGQSESSELPFEAGQGSPPLPDTGTAENPGHVPYFHQRLSISKISERATAFRALCESRRTLRFFSKDHVPQHVMEDIIATAVSAPSGAHKQPWHFCLIGNPNIKRGIRKLVEKEEQANYARRMRQSWVEDLKAMMSAVHDTKTITKPYLTDAPWLIVVLKQPFGADKNGKKIDDHYYVPESVGIACGLLVTAIHNANLTSLTSTPMGAGSDICKLLKRPSHEKVFLLLPVGFPAKNATVPFRDPQRKSLEEVMSVF